MSANILIVEDEFAIALDLQDRLESMGYTIVELAHNYKDALAATIEFSPDLVLMDINLNDSKTGIETAILFKEKFNTPVIFCTALTDKSTFESAMKAQPFGFINKPFDNDELRNNIELTLHKLAENDSQKKTRDEVVEDFIFVKDKNRLCKLDFSEIEYAEAMDNYTNVYSNKNKRYVVSTYLGEFLNHLPKNKFIRVHRSFVVSINAIKAIEGNQIILINDHSITIGRSYLKDVMSKIHRVT
ncbi:LytR/AlgR family response regulator transcription factor [Parvicella tangerina]|uniref:Protein-glutamate methylesterase/protein-glutamine glutaminase n=1 Tax=Parvicella tangerina TaxID=2829795 RepID=A0A916JJR1_9FLAO|nr:response regulator [Parvicella tangerina]CAG5077310.1 Protein-glutamate methylesterase/protein-glutamine glutaminase [Parvicella tangerina]